MKITNLKVYDLQESLIASGYPMKTSMCDHVASGKDWDRGYKLARLSKKDNPAHGQWLTGIRVAFDLTCSNKMWVEAERYRFLEFVSSQSTMHRITKFNLDDVYNEYVDPRIIEVMKEKVARYNEIIAEEDPSITPEKIKDLYLEILYSNPAGFELTARLTTNYRCLLNIYEQRQNHRLPEWREFCDYMYHNLPYFDEFVNTMEI